VLEAVGEEGDERAGFGQDVARPALGIVDAQCAAVAGTPRGVEIEDEREHAGVVVAEPVDVSLVARPRQVERVVALVAPQAQRQLAVDRGAQPFERGPELALRRRRIRLVEPADAIAAHVGAHDARAAPPRPGRREQAGAVAAKRLRAQSCDRLRGEKPAHDGKPAVGEPGNDRGDGAAPGGLRQAAPSGCKRGTVRGPAIILPSHCGAELGCASSSPAERGFSASGSRARCSRAER
jgi:hypothetical protein